MNREELERLEESELCSYLYRNILTNDERERLARENITLADIFNGRVVGGLAPYRNLVENVNNRVGYELFLLDCF